MEKSDNIVLNRDIYIGGSDLPSILDLNKKYGVTTDIFARQKAGLEERDFKKNEYTVYGDLLEPKIREYVNFAFDTNYREATVIDDVRMYRGNADGYDPEADIPLLEIKTFGSRLDWKYYQYQCQFYMELFDVKSCLLVGYKRPQGFYWGLGNYDERYFDTEFNKDNLEYIHIYRDNELFENMDNKIKEFRKLVNKYKGEKDGTITTK